LIIRRRRGKKMHDSRFEPNRRNRRAEKKKAEKREAVAVEEEERAFEDENWR
jgi:hypothetical protein